VLTLAAGAVGVTLFVLAAFALMTFQSLRHRRARREEIRTRGALSDEEREDARVRRRMDGEPSDDRDPRVVPWWEW
jgi:hypothetical protein